MEIAPTTTDYQASIIKQAGVLALAELKVNTLAAMVENQAKIISELEEAVRAKAATE